jgi:hypothetical protein
VSGYSRHKFRVPTMPILKREIFLTLFYNIPLLRGVEKHFTEDNKYFPMVFIYQVTG